MNKRTQDEVRHALDAGLSGVKASGGTMQWVMKRAHRAKRMQRRLTLIPALALLMMGMLAAAACASFAFGVLDFLPERAEDAAYCATIFGIDEQFENRYLSLRINEAAFDGTRLDMTMDIRHQAGAGPVFVLPSITARCGEKELSVSAEMMNFSWDTGFFLPEQLPRHVETEQAGATFQIEDGAVEEEITWTLSFDVLRPRYPIQINPQSLDDEEDIPFDVYIQAYIDAYRDGVILLDPDGELVMYDGALSMGAEFGENPWRREGFAQRMIDCGAFERVDVLTAEFVTR